jgi:hypothetical protein
LVAVVNVLVADVAVSVLVVAVVLV